MAQEQELELVNAEGYETVSDTGSDNEEFEESILERVTALVDIVPPLTRYYIANQVSSTFNTTFSLLKTIGSGLWVLSTAALLVGLPAGLELERDAMAIQQEFQYYPCYPICLLVRMRNSFDFYYLMIPKLDWQTPPMILPEPLFDFSVCYNQKDLDLIYSSAVEPQRLTTINEITKIITENPDILVHLLNMDFCYNVVEHNPSLLTVFIRSAPDCTDLVMNAMHQHCLELSVLEISKSMAQDKLVGPEQVYILLEKMASACEMIHDREILDRKVRLVCLFAKSLLADNILQIDVVSVILDSFCLKFSRLKDAVELYRYLKQ